MLTLTGMRSYAQRGAPPVLGEERDRDGNADSVTASEFAFLAMGLILGVAAGAALVEFVRARPPAPREIRVTVSPDAVPRRRASTLANDAFTDSPVVVDPAVGGPADPSIHAWTETDVEADGADAGRTPVLPPPPGNVPQPAFRLSPPPARADGIPVPAAAARPAAQGVPVSSGIDPMLTALRASAAASAEAAMAAGRPVATAERPTAVQSGNGPTGAAAGAGAATTAADTPGAASGVSAPAAVPAGPCGDARYLADERCELASRARAQAVEAQDAHRAAQRAYDEHESAIAAAAAATDPRAVREAKDEAQARFRTTRAAAGTAELVEAAARAWLHEINRINAQTGDAHAMLAGARSKTPEMAMLLEQTALAADAARVAAETAEAACTAARQAVADCEERAAGRIPSPAPSTSSDERPADDTTSDTLVAALRAGSSPRIVRLLRGDRMAMQEVVTALGGEDAAERRRWQAAMSDLVDAIVSDAVASSSLEFPTDHTFWAPFDRAQARDITAALSSLGYRFDGRGGWVDDRYPSQRDLSLAMGYAGLDPMRMRQWPTDAEMSSLFEDVEVTAAEHLAEVAGDLTLGELVTMLGRRADGLADIWNDWGRIRPLLLDDG
jgi:hypothetical protein